MKLWNYLDIAKLEQHIHDKLVDCRWHRDFDDLMILSYGRRAVYDNVWDDVTTRCRGLIVNFHTGDIVARPFEKFFNINTSDRPETHFLNLPCRAPSVTEKLDGSLGILYRHRGVNSVASKGSFHSEHAEWATKWYRENVLNPSWPEGWTPVVEMICESVQHHVVHYGWEGLVLTAMINSDTGEEKNREEVERWARWNGLRYVKEFRMSTEQALQANPTNEEGYVLTWHRQLETPIRVKVKVPEFLRLQKIMHGISPRTVFEHLRENGAVPAEWLDTAMPHVADAVRKWVVKLQNDYADIHRMAANIVTAALKECTTRKEFAAYFNRELNKPYAPVCFALLDEKDYRKPIWKLVGPYVDGKPIHEEEFEEDVPYHVKTDMSDLHGTETTGLGTIDNPLTACVGNL